MNKPQFNQFRADFGKLAQNLHNTTISFNVKHCDTGVYKTMECAKDSIGRISFSDIWEKKFFPNHYFQIGQKGFLNQLEMNRLQDLINSY